MRKIIFLALLSSLFFSSFTYSTESAYRLKEGDTLKISVWGEDTLNQEITVLPDGSISFPLVGTVNVDSMTVPQVVKEISKRLTKYIPDPNVSVVVSATQGNRIYVLGKVKTPGSFVMAGPMTVIQVLSLGGGLDKFANTDKIRVIRNTKGSQKQLVVKYEDIMSGSDLSTNYLLQAGDTILVP